MIGMLKYEQAREALARYPGPNHLPNLFGGSAMAVFESSTQHQTPALHEWKKSVDRYTAKRRPGALLPPWTCTHCGSEFTGRKRKFCGDECAAEAKRIRDSKRKMLGRVRTRPFKSIRRPNPIIDGKRECIDCGVTFPLSEYSVLKCSRCKSGETIRGVCKACERQERSARSARRSPERRREQRALAAIKAGKTYTPKNSKAELAKKTTRLAKQNAKQAWDWWFTQAPDDWMATYYEALGQPWRNPRLTNTERYRIRYAQDVEFNLNERIRNQQRKKARRDGVAEIIRGAIRRNGRSPRVEKLLGYSIAELKVHLERQFSKGMDWPRFMAGEIHIDHIIPKKEFDLQDDTQWRKCWCLSNLRPLWAKDNLEKRDRVLHLL